MVLYSSFYEILNISENASTENIKTAFRKLALLHHPDKNKNHPESNTRFILIFNAYTILSNPVKRKEYDEYLKNSKVIKQQKSNALNLKSTLPENTNDIDSSNKALCNNFNFLLWDIEDLLNNKKNPDWSIQIDIPFKKYILKVLTFIDKWVLGPAGFPDYFMEARNLKKIDPFEYIAAIGQNKHYPYVNIKGYFYDIRKRMDKFLSQHNIKTLFDYIPDNNIRLIDCIIEAQNHTIHYLSYLLRMHKEKLENIPIFEHSKSCFLRFTQIDM